VEGAGRLESLEDEIGVEDAADLRGGSLSRSDEAARCLRRDCSDEDMMIGVGKERRKRRRKAERNRVTPVTRRSTTGMN
jgi:hypothetical protein